MTLQREPYYEVSALQVQLKGTLIHNLERRPGVRLVELLKLVSDGCESHQHSPHGCWPPSQHQEQPEDVKTIS